MFRKRPDALLSRYASIGARCKYTSDSMQMRELVRKLDYDGYLCGLLLPVETRPSYFSIRALNAEVATIKDSTFSNLVMGRIRMQWWRERIFNLYDYSVKEGNSRPTQSTALLRGLDKAIHEHNLTRRWFERLLDARDLDLNREEVLSMQELKTYAEQTASSLLYLTLECLGVRDETADCVAEHAGVAIGLTTLLRGTPYHSLRKETYLPQALLDKHDLSIMDVLGASEKPSNGDKLAPVVFEVACCAMDHLRQARSLRKNIPKEARSAFLPLISSSLYLKDLEAANFNVFAPELQQRNMFQLHLQVLKHYFWRKY
ncbi:hypothetical protein CCR75_004467 [Bremia lactucae]|uniref:Phytoene synthase n=1 Tax=Bremia lactucae TaxID=4779 RepID=A0A976FJX8_BRELC|nr:hypothetical protein CCR75_004467 [Bremia lactucae]